EARERSLRCLSAQGSGGSISGNDETHFNPMGLLDMFSKAKEESKIQRIPSGSFSVDRTGKVGVSTLPRSFSQDNVEAITDAVLGSFQTARDANIPLTEIFICY